MALMVSVLDHGILLKPQTIREGNVEPFFSETKKVLDENGDTIEIEDKKQNEKGSILRRVKNMDEPDWANLKNRFEDKMGKGYLGSFKRKRN